MAELHFRTATELANMIRSKKISCVELLEYFLRRCDKYNSQINAIINYKREAALQRASRADEAMSRGVSWGPLHGVPMTIKECFDWEGTPTTWGVPKLRDNIAVKNSVVVQRMLDAGVVLFGKTNVPFMLGDWETFNQIYGTTNNPWDLTRVPGGSSGGSASALAAGLTALEAGSDIGASIRNPAHSCGVFGHKTTWGIVPTRGQSLPGMLSHSDISVVGPLARGADNLSVALQVMAGPDELESDGYKLGLLKPFKKKLSEFRVAVMVTNNICPIDDEYADKIQMIADACANRE